MAVAILQLTSSSYSNFPTLLRLKLPKPHSYHYRHPISLTITANKYSAPITNFQSNRLFSSITTLSSLKPYLQSQWQPILCGWLCSAVSVYSLSKLVPKLGEFSSALMTLKAVRFQEEGLVLGTLFMTRLMAMYLQQAFLWEAALNCVYTIRIYVFRRVLQRDLGFFEGEHGVSAGDIAYRITAEAADVADTIYSLLNTIVPYTLQLSAMAIQMLVISPVLTSISALGVKIVLLFLRLSP